MKSVRALVIGLAEWLCESVAIRLVEHPRVAKAIGRTLLYHYVVFGDEARVTIAPNACINNAFLNVESGRITIEDYAFFGFNVCLLAGTHATESRGSERQLAVPKDGFDIVVRSGAWIASNATIIGPAVIGEHAVVAAGAVVTGDVPAKTLVAGVPARPVRHLDEKTDCS
jgi:acetyltransferase-like isoleucine patch superfamily enzyme